MTPAIDLRPEDLTILRDILAAARLPPSIGVWVFGSRVTGAARRYSDIDLALKGEQPLNPDILFRLKDTLSESDLTIKVDLVDLRAVDETFRRLIEGHMVPFGLSAEGG